MAEPALAERLSSGFAVWKILVRARIRADWQYRTSFFLFLLGQMLASGLDLAAIAVIFGQVDSLAGWSGAEVALLYGISATAFGIADVVISQVENVDLHVREGTFDTILLRPISPLLQLSGSGFALRRLGRPIQPIVVTAIALTIVDVDWSPAAAVMLALALVCGVVIFGAIWVLTNTIVFWTVDARESANAFTYGGVTLSEYPIDVFSSWLRRLVLFVVPLAFTAYLPVAWLLDKPAPDGLSVDLAWATPLVAAAAVLAARLAWTQGIRAYRSTGS